MCVFNCILRPNRATCATNHHHHHYFNYYQLSQCECVSTTSSLLCICISCVGVVRVPDPHRILATWNVCTTRSMSEPSLCDCLCAHSLRTRKFFLPYLHPHTETHPPSPPTADRAVDIHRENLKKKRRELEQASLDAASDFLDTDSNATFAMV